VLNTAPDADPAGIFRADLPVMIHVGYRAAPGVRRAIFDLELVDSQGRSVFTTPETTAELRRVDLAQEGWVRMALGPFDLPPGEYTAVARVRSPSGAEHDRLVHRIPLVMLGTQQPKIPVETPYTWRRFDGRFAAFPGLPLMQLRVLCGGRQPVTLEAGAGPVEIEVWMSEHQEPGGRMAIRLLRGDGSCLHTARGPTLELDRERIHRFTLDRLDLSPGRYIVELEYSVGDRVEIVRHRLDLRQPGAPERSPLVSLDHHARWQIVEDASPAADGRPALSSAELLPEVAGGERALAPGDEATLRATISGLEPRAGAPVAVQLRAWIESPFDPSVALIDAPALASSPAGAALVELGVVLDLLDGEYLLCCAVWDRESDQPAGPVRSFPFRIRSTDRRDGGGVIRARHQMVVTR
jgi:hypothetical protein